jgi:hypothetical protein
VRGRCALWLRAGCEIKTTMLITRETRMSLKLLSRNGLRSQPVTTARIVITCLTPAAARWSYSTSVRGRCALWLRAGCEGHSASTISSEGKETLTRCYPFSVRFPGAVNSKFTSETTPPPCGDDARCGYGLAAKAIPRQELQRHSGLSRYPARRWSSSISQRPGSDR